MKYTNYSPDNELAIRLQSWSSSFDFFVNGDCRCLLNSVFGQELVWHEIHSHPAYKFLNPTQSFNFAAMQLPAGNLGYWLPVFAIFGAMNFWFYPNNIILMTLTLDDNAHCLECWAEITEDALHHTASLSPNYPANLTQ